MSIVFKGTVLYYLEPLVDGAVEKIEMHMYFSQEY